MSGEIARFDGVNHAYGRNVALREMSVAVPAGCLAGLIGPDGVGKSTFMSLVAGVTRLQSGRLEVLDRDMAVAAERRSASVRIAFMPQGLGRNLYPKLSVAENLDFFGRLFGQPGALRRQRSRHLLEVVGLAPFADRLAGQLSGGMKQKLGICAALLHEPDLLILDEPTTGIDPLSRRQFWDLIDEMRRQRPAMSLLLSTAYMEEAEKFDWLAALYDGRIVASGKPQAICAQAQAENLERAFIAFMPDDARRRQAYAGRAFVDHGDGTPAIAANGLTRRFDGFTAVDHVDFSIRKGEIFGFLGSNGGGKTTTMKMLTGLLPASEGQAWLFGRPVDARDVQARRRVGYMSQSFSLYGELSVRRNLRLHAKLYGIDDADRRIDDAMSRFDLVEVADSRSEDLPLGIRQRLQLAVAVLHRPEILILDEPTSGVDPVARDMFWSYLGALSREEGVTIFLSTHFMSEADRCDRISFMHEGRLLAIGSPAELKAVHGTPHLDEVFVRTIERAGGERPAQGARQVFEEEAPAARPPRRHDPGRLLAYARREVLEILRDPARLVFAIAGPALLLIAFGYGISFDVENLSFAAYDQDRSAQSRQLLENFQGSRYFEERPAIASPAELEARLQSGELTVVVEIPPGFGRDLERGLTPEVGVWLDGAMPFRAQVARGYISGLAANYLGDANLRRAGAAEDATPVRIETRFLYNQAFKSANAIVPNVIVLLLMLIPAIMSTLSVVKEKESGSIVNFRATPSTQMEFLLGKQMPYVAIAFVSFVAMALLAKFLFGLSMTGSLATLAFGSLLYVMTSTAFGLLVSSFVRTQVAAVFATAILAVIPTVNFSGLMVPMSSLSGGARLMGMGFPAAWYQPVSVGVYAKGLGMGDLRLEFCVLFAFAFAFVCAAVVCLPKQSR